MLMLLIKTNDGRNLFWRHAKKQILFTLAKNSLTTLHFSSNGNEQQGEKRHPVSEWQGWSARKAIASEGLLKELEMWAKPFEARNAVVKLSLGLIMFENWEVQNVWCSSSTMNNHVLSSHVM